MIFLSRRKQAGLLLGTILPTSLVPYAVIKGENKQACGNSRLESFGVYNRKIGHSLLGCQDALTGCLLYAMIILKCIWQWSQMWLLGSVNTQSRVVVTQAELPSVTMPILCLMGRCLLVAIIDMRKGIGFCHIYKNIKEKI